jgi:integrase
MGLYVKNAWYHYRKQIKGQVYYQALKIKKGQEKLLSARLEQVEEEITARHFGLPYGKNESIGLSDFIKRYLEIKTDKKSWDRDSQRLELVGEVWGDRPLSSIGKEQIEKLEKYLVEKKKIRPATINRYFEMLRHFFNLAIEEGHLKENPLRGYEFFQEDGARRALSREEISRIMESARKMETHPRTSIQAIIADLILFALNTGMRLSEILFLKKSYIVEDMIYYPASKTKSRRRSASSQPRFKLVLLNPQARAIIERYKPQDDYIFPMRWRNPNAVFHAVHRLRKETGISDFTFHELRHTASTIISSQSSLATAKMVLGHADIKTTLQYTHPGLDEQRKSVKKLGKYFEAIVPN